MSAKQKNERLNLRLSSADKQNVIYHSKLMNISANEYIELCIRRKRIVICEDFPELIYQLSKIGTNINQIAAVANKNEYISAKNIEETKNLMNKCYDLMNSFISFISEPENDFLKSDTSKVSELLGELSNSVKSINSRLVKIEQCID